MTKIYTQKTIHPAQAEGGRALMHAEDLPIAAVLRALLHSTKGRRQRHAHGTVDVCPGVSVVWEVWLAGPPPNMYGDTVNDPSLWAWSVDIKRTEGESTFLERDSWGVESSAEQAVITCKEKAESITGKIQIARVRGDQ